MIKLYTAATQKDAYTSLLRGFAEDYKRNGAESRYLIIAADRYTLQCEKDFVAATGKRGAANIDVETFQRFAARTMPNVKCMSPEAAVMLMNKTAIEKNPELTYYRDAVSFPEFAGDVFETLVAMRSSGVTQEILKDKLNGMSGSLKEKTKDLIILYDALLHKMSEVFVDGTSRLERLKEHLKVKGFPRHIKIYVAQFIRFNHQQLELLRFFQENGNEVHISLPASPADVDLPQDIYPDFQFDVPADATDSKCSSSKPEREDSGESEKQYLLRELFAFAQPKTLRFTTRFELGCAGDKRSEIVRVAYHIKQLIRSGARYRDMLVVCADPASYLPMIREVFDEMHITYHMDFGKKLSEHFAFDFVVRAFEVVRSGFRQDEYISFIKNPLLGIDKNALYDYLTYIRLYNLNFDRFRRELTYGDMQQCANAEMVRAQVADVLSPLVAAGAKNTAGAYTDALKTIFERMGFADVVDGIAQNQLQAGDPTGAAISAQVVEKINGLLDNVKALLGEAMMSIKEYSNMLAQAAMAIKVNLLPLTSDCVLVRQTNTAVVDKEKYLFVVGANSSTFPTVGGDNVIINQKEVDKWNEVLKDKNVRFYPTPLDNNKLERFCILQLILSDFDKMFIYRTSSNGEGKKTFASFVTKRLCEIFVGEDGKTKLQEVAIPRYSFPIEPAVLTRVSRLTLPADKIARLYFKERNRTSISEFETYFECPYKHFLDYGLRLKEVDDSGMNAMDFGSIIHRVLELYYRKKYKLTDDIDIIRQRVVPLVDRTMNEDRFLRYQHAPDYGMLRMSIVKECVALIVRMGVYLADSDFHPTEFEWRFDTTDTHNEDACLSKCASSGAEQNEDSSEVYRVPDLSLCGRRSGFAVDIIGKVDRVDTCGDYAFVIDYKTGYVSSDLKDVYMGEKLQLYAYLYYYTAFRGKIPVGAFYVPVKGGQTSDEAPKKLFVGKLINDPDVCKTLRKEGDIKDLIAPKDIVPAVAIEELQRYVIELCRVALDEIVEGYIERKPLENESGSSQNSEDKNCLYCPMKYHCDDRMVRYRHFDLPTFEDKED